MVAKRVGEGCVEQEDLTVLFLGDSWMEDLNGIPMGFAESVSNPAGAHPACVRIVNAGVSSFSPSLMLLKGRSLLAQYQPALIVVQIDATDIMDESLRYAGTLLRILVEIAEDTGVRFYDAAGNMLDMYDGEFERYTNWPQGPFSHVTQEGYRRYGRALASAVRLPID